MNNMGSPPSILKTTEKRMGLYRAGIGCLDLPTINITQGCLHKCVYCYANEYEWVDKNNVTLYSNIDTLIQEEIKHKRNKPRRIYLSSASDCFQPNKAVQEKTYNILQYLYKEKIQVAILTKGEIAPETMELITNFCNSGNTYMQIGLNTIRPEIWKQIEPNTAHPEIRIEQIKKLISCGVKTSIRLDPIIPNVTDKEDDLREIFKRIVEIGVKQISISYMFIRPSMLHNFPPEIKDKFINEYTEMDTLELCCGSKLPPMKKEIRKKKLEFVKDLAESYGLEVSICGCKNPDLYKDFPKNRCRIAGDIEDL
jgi:DNA repair photolyase